MLHRSGPYDEEKLVKSLKGYLPMAGSEENDSFEVPYFDDEMQKVMIANFVWLNGQWVFIDTRDH